MKRTLIYLGGMVAICITLISCSYVIAKTNDSSAPNVENSLQFPNTNWRLVKHSFRLNIPQKNNALSQLMIEAPSTVAVSNDIDVLDTNGRKLNINVSVNGKQIVINFPDQVVYSTKIIVNLNRVKQPVTGLASVYHLSVKVVGSDTEIPVGVVQFPTF